MNTIALEQGSPEWHQARCGSLGASAIADMLAKTKTGWSASRANLHARLVVEQLTGTPQDTYQNGAMLQGIEREPQARARYEFACEVTVQTVGLIPHPTIAKTHASPDGLVGVDGLIEIKCPQLAAHLATVEGGPIPDKYHYQMQWQMACSGRSHCDFVSFNPDFPPEMRLFIRRVLRDDALIGAVEPEVRKFLSDVDAKVAALRAKFLKEAV